MSSSIPSVKIIIAIALAGVADSYAQSLPPLGVPSVASNPPIPVQANLQVPLVRPALMHQSNGVALGMPHTVFPTPAAPTFSTNPNVTPLVPPTALDGSRPPISSPTGIDASIANKATVPQVPPPFSTNSQPPVSSAKPIDGSVLSSPSNNIPRTNFPSTQFSASPNPPTKALSLVVPPQFLTNTPSAVSDSPFDDIKSSNNLAPVVDNSRHEVKFTDAPFAHVMRLLAKQAGINYIEPSFSQDNEEPNLTIDIADTTALEAFKKIAEYRGYDVTDFGGIYSLDRPDMQGKQAMIIKKYKLRWLDPMWTLQAIANLLGISVEKPDKNLRTYPEPEDQFTSSSSGGSGSGGTSGGASGGSSASGSSGSSSGSSGSTIVSLPTKPRWAVTLPFDAPASKGGYMKDQSGQDSVLFIDRRDNAIMVRATRSEHRIIAQYVAENDRPEPQIAIDVKIIEVTANSGLNQGVDWSGPFGSGTNNGLTFSLDRPKGVLGTVGFDPLSFAFKSSGMILSMTNATVTFRNLMTKDKGQALSVPRVVTKSGVPVTIRSGVQDPVPIQTLVTGATAGGNQAFTGSFQMFSTGLTMDTVATLFDDGFIDLNINPVVSREIGKKQIPGVGDVPIISTRMASTTVSVRSGETVVIGGLYEVTKTEGSTGVPPFDKIPVLGKLLFGTHSSDKTRRNLIIFVTPHLITPAEEVGARLNAATAELYESEERLDNPLTIRPIPPRRVPVHGTPAQKTELAPPITEPVPKRAGHSYSPRVAPGE